MSVPLKMKKLVFAEEVRNSKMVCSTCANPGELKLDLRHSLNLNQWRCPRSGLICDDKFQVHRKMIVPIFNLAQGNSSSLNSIKLKIHYLHKFINLYAFCMSL